MCLMYGVEDIVCALFVRTTVISRLIKYNNFDANYLGHCFDGLVDSRWSLFSSDFLI